jgi:hypothetical protein
MTDRDSGRSAPTNETSKAEESEAKAAHQADRPPTAEEEKAAPGRESLSPETAKNFDDMAKKGADVKGEGELP